MIPNNSIWQVEHEHDGEDPPDCVGQWCCGCVSHPIGKPWGWNSEAWQRHYAEAHGDRP